MVSRKAYCIFLCYKAFKIPLGKSIKRCHTASRNTTWNTQCSLGAKIQAEVLNSRLCKASEILSLYQKNGFNKV